MDLLTQVYEFMGRAGTVCRMGDDFGDEAMLKMTKMSPEELLELLSTICSPSGRPVNWHAYIKQFKLNDPFGRGYKEYLRSPAWERKREAVMKRAEVSELSTPLQWIVTYDNYDRCIRKLKTEPPRSVCENGSCPNTAEHVHHLHYKTVGKEDIREDLQAVCGECHQKLHS